MDFTSAHLTFWLLRERISRRNRFFFDWTLMHFSAKRITKMSKNRGFPGHSSPGPNEITSPVASMKPNQGRSPALDKKIIHPHSGIKVGTSCDPRVDNMQCNYSFPPSTQSAAFTRCPDAFFCVSVYLPTICALVPADFLHRRRPLPQKLNSTSSFFFLQSHNKKSYLCFYIILWVFDPYFVIWMQKSW